LESDGDCLAARNNVHCHAKITLGLPTKKSSRSRRIWQGVWHDNVDLAMWSATT
jgi:hypothetical protein